MLLLCVCPAAYLMTSTDLDHNDKLLAQGKKEKLEWVTPKMTLMETNITLGTKRWNSYEGFREGSLLFWRGWYGPGPS